MNKKKRKKPSRSRQQAPVRATAPTVGTAPPQNPLAALREAIAAMRGRRAVTLLEHLVPAEDLGKETLTRLTALARETQARELIANGHASEARQAVCAAVKRKPDILPFLSLGLRLRCGLEPDIEKRLDDPDWLLRLRRELVEPGDLADTALGGFDLQAAALLEAWRLVDAGRNEAANDRLKPIGRRSPLVDWRLFLQVLMATQSGDTGQADNALARMLPGCCAHRLAGAVIAYTKAQLAPTASETAKTENADPEPHISVEASIHDSLRSFDPVALLRELAAHLRQHGLDASQERIVSDARRLHTMGCPGLGIGLLVATQQSLPERSVSGFKRRFAAMLPEPWRVGMRSGCDGKPIVTPDEADLAAKKTNLWTPRERAVILVEAAREARRYALRDNTGPIPRSILESVLDDGFDDDDDDYDDKDYYVKDVRAWSRLAASIWPELTDSYELWSWADQFNRPDSSQALEARARAMPDNPDAWEALAAFALKQVDHALFDQAMARLGTLSGTTQRCADLQERFRFIILAAAFVKGDKALVQAEAALFTGQNLFRQIAVAIMDWLSRTDRSSKIAAGEKLADLGHPWLVMKTAFDLRKGLSPSALPLPLRKALEDENSSTGVLTDFVMVLRQEGKIPELRKDLKRTLVRALGAPSPPLPLVAEVAFGIIEDYRLLAPQATGAGSCSRAILDLSTRMIHHDEPDWQAQSLMLRAILLEHVQRISFDAQKFAQTLLLGAATLLAASSESHQRLALAIESCEVLPEQLDKQVRRLADKHLDALLQNQRESVETADELIAQLMPLRPANRRTSRPKVKRPSRYPPFKIPQEPKPPAPSHNAFSDFNVDRFFPTTSLEFEMGIESAKLMQPQKRTQTLARIRTLIDSSISLTDGAKARLSRMCDQADNRAPS